VPWYYRQELKFIANSNLGGLPSWHKGMQIPGKRLALIALRTSISLPQAAICSTQIKRIEKGKDRGRSIARHGTIKNES
jgi:hypothetical protein